MAAHRPRRGRHPVPEVDWDHAYGDDGATLREAVRGDLRQAAEGLLEALDAKGSGRGATKAEERENRHEPRV